MTRSRSPVGVVAGFHAGLSCEVNAAHRLVADRRMDGAPTFRGRSGL
jgi:hypothetical protein